MTKVEIVATAIVDEFTRMKDADDAAIIYVADYEPSTPATEALVVDGKFDPTEMARAILKALGIDEEEA